MARPSQAQTGLFKGIEGLAEGFSRGLEQEEARAQRMALQQALDARKEQERSLQKELRSVPSSMFDKMKAKEMGIVLDENDPYQPVPVYNAYLAGLTSRQNAKNRPAPKPSWKPFEFGEIPKRGAQAASSQFADRLMGGGFENLGPEDIPEVNKFWQTYAGGELERYAQQPGAPRLGIRPGEFLMQGAEQKPTGWKSLVPGLGGTPGTVQLSQSPWTVEEDVMASVKMGRDAKKTDQEIKAILDAGGWSVPLEVIMAIPR